MNTPLLIDGMLGMGDTIYQRAFVKQLPAGTYIKTAWPELYEDLPVNPVRSCTTLRTQRKNEHRTKIEFLPPPSPRQTKRIFYGPAELARGSIFDAMREQFVASRPGTLGFDVNPTGIGWLNERGAYADLYANQWRALTMWDVLEHIDEPDLAVRQATEFVFVSIPIFADAGDIVRSHHFRKTEHIWYFTDDGIKRWFAEQGFECVEQNTIECHLGRKGVASYAFRRV